MWENLTKKFEWLFCFFCAKTFHIPNFLSPKSSEAKISKRQIKYVGLETGNAGEMTRVSISERGDTREMTCISVCV